MSSTTVLDPFWQYYRRLVKDKMIPYQWAVITDQANITIERENDRSPIAAVEKSHAINNLKIAAGQAKGDFYGFWFQDSDVYKWLEAVAYALRYAPDQTLQHEADQVIDLIADAQEADGYLDTYFQIKAPNRKFKHVSKSHELYCMGHYIEAGVAYYQTTDNKKALKIAIKMANCIDQHFGPKPHQLHGYPGHPEIELALARLAEQTNEIKYSRLAKYMLDQRGTQPNFFEQQAQESKNIEEDYWAGNEPNASYLQNDQPVRKLQHAEGHAVRMVYLLTGMAHIARQTQDQSLFKATKQLWTDIIQRQMYLTGGVGQTPDGEAFTFDYDLPNDTMYCETCASCAMAFLAKQLLQADPKGEYADVLEKELYNSTISGMALDGEHFFYVNPLSVNPEASIKDPLKSHVKVTRPSWFACACCPPNLARLIASIDQYLYTEKDQIIYSHLFIGNDTTFANGLTVSQHSNYPWSGKINYHISAKKPTHSTVALRIPAWSPQTKATINGQSQTLKLKNGYWFISKTFDSKATVITLDLDMTPQRVTADPRITADLGKVALQRGPIVYCLEQADNGTHLPWCSLPEQSQINEQIDSETLPTTIVKLTATGQKLTPRNNEPYTPTTQTVPLTFIPYFAWANRTPGEMTVWIDEKE